MNGKIVGFTVLFVVIVVSLFSLQSFRRVRAKQPSLLLGTNVWPGYEPFYLARSLGYFDERSIRLVECTSASQVITAFRNHTIDVAALTLDEVLLLKELGHDVQVILVNDTSHGGDVILGQADVKEFGDLRGRSVGVEHTALGAYVLMRAFQLAGMSVEDVNVVPLAVDQHEQAFLAHDVDAVVTFEPVRSRLLSAGAVQLFDSTQIEGEIVDVLTIRDGTLADNAENIDLLLRGWFQGLAYLRDHPEDAAQRMSGRLKLTPPEALASLDGIVFPTRDENMALLGGVRPPLVEVADRLTKLMRQENLLKTDIDVTRLFSARAIKNLKR